jgi:hypothetical protein
MNADTVAIALDRLKFYAKDALNVVSQVGRTKAASKWLRLTAHASAYANRKSRTKTLL